jgi:hypothetical protein
LSSYRPYDPALADRLIELGREGLCRSEMAARLDVLLADFDAWAAAEPAFAVALERAETQARAWWESQPRLALENGKPFRAAVWAKAMAQRYGRQSDRPSAKAADAKKPVRVEAIFEIPDNGRDRRPGRKRPAGGRGGG